jgi:DNA processing protein
MVALLRTGRRPWVEYAECAEQLGSAAAALEHALEAERAPGGQTSLVLNDDRATVADPASLEDAIARSMSDLQRWDAQGMRLTTVLDPGFPRNLREVHDRPPILFIAGRLTDEDAKAIAVVGTRQATRPGTRRAAQIAEHLAQTGYTVLSGLAAGIDTAAHTAALSAGGRTVAVIGTGLARSYPPQNQALQRRITEQCAVVSQFWPDAPPTKRSFPMRNAVMSGMALATVVIEASETSGARMQARLALAQGRPVFLLESLLETQRWAREYAARPATHVVSSPDEITAAVDRLISPGALLA